jgi:hypothetical protein
MTLPRRLRVSFLLLLTLLLVAGPLAAAMSGHRSRGAVQSGLSVTGALSEVWAFVSRIWTKEGSGVDPFGKAGGSTDPFGKAGNSIDPFGKSGSSSDPFGKPTPSTQPPSSGSSTESQPAPGR